MNQRSLEAKIRVGKFRPIPEQYSQELSEAVNSMLRVNVSNVPSRFIIALIKVQSFLKAIIFLL